MFYSKVRGWGIGRYAFLSAFLCTIFIIYCLLLVLRVPWSLFKLAGQQLKSFLNHLVSYDMFQVSQGVSSLPSMIHVGIYTGLPL